MDMVSYSVGRDQIKDGDIVFMAHRHSIPAFLIHIFTRSIYSHCNMAFWIDTPAGKRLLAVEAQGGTTRRIINLSYYEKLCDMHVVSPPADWATTVSPVALKELGFMKYGYLEAFYVGLREFLLKYLGIKIAEKNLGEICSEFIARVNNMPDQQISPGALMTELNAEGHPIKLMISRTK
jgi:hypothetical protein